MSLGHKLVAPVEGADIPNEGKDARNVLGPKLMGTAPAGGPLRPFETVRGGQADTALVTNPPPEAQLPLVPVKQMRTVLKTAPELLASFVQRELGLPPAEQRRSAFELFHATAKANDLTELAQLLEDVLANEPGPVMTNQPTSAENDTEPVVIDETEKGLADPEE